MSEKNAVEFINTKFTLYIKIPAITFQMSRHKFIENPLGNMLSLSTTSGILILKTIILICWINCVTIINTKMGKEQSLPKCNSLLNLFQSC